MKKLGMVGVAMSVFARMTDELMCCVMRNEGDKIKEVRKFTMAMHCLLERSGLARTSSSAKQALTIEVQMRLLYLVQREAPWSVARASSCTC